MDSKKPMKIAIVGGGAAGFFTAINTAQNATEQNVLVDVAIFESTNQYLKKVRISGGGRCNVTHNCFEVPKFVENYPRGSRELISPMQRFQAKDTLQWFRDLGVKIVAEEDGRMFPESNSSETIIDCYLEQIEKYKIALHLKSPIKAIVRRDNGQLELQIKDKDPLVADFVMIATGSSKGGYELAKMAGHTITELAPSLFSFKIKDPLLDELQGLSFPKASLILKLPNKKKYKQQGSVLITHWGLSGPAVLKLSAWAARDMQRADYQGTLRVNWLGYSRQEDIEQLLLATKVKNSKSFVRNSYPEELPKRFWQNLLKKCKIDEEKQWANINKKEMNTLRDSLFAGEFEILGQNRFKEEFVECGGVSLKEINFKSMESKKVPGLYFAGEILDVDGITGGFNFQNAWTTGWIAAQDMVARALERG